MNNKGHIIAVGSGRNMIEDRRHPIHDYIFNLSDEKSPRVGFLPTATGDSSEYIASFYQTYNTYLCRPSHLPLFAREASDLAPWFFEQDIIYVGGGNTANMLAVWRLHGVDTLLWEFLEQGGVVWGGSAGGLCWFEGGITDSFGLYDLVPFDQGLRFLSGSFCPHLSVDPARGPAYQKALRQGDLVPGWGVDDFAALHFFDGKLLRALSLLPDAKAYAFDSNGNSEDLDMEDLY